MGREVLLMLCLFISPSGTFLAVQKYASEHWNQIHICLVPLQLSNSDTCPMRMSCLLSLNSIWIILMKKKKKTIETGRDLLGKSQPMSHVYHMDICQC